MNVAYADSRHVNRHFTPIISYSLELGSSMIFKEFSAWAASLKPSAACLKLSLCVIMSLTFSFPVVKTANDCSRSVGAAP